MSSVDDAHKALLAGARASTELPMTGANLPFEKPAGGAPWVRVTVISNEPSVATLGKGGSDETDGILQIDLNFPLFEGVAAAALEAKQISLSLYPGRVLAYGTACVHLAGFANPRSTEVAGYYRHTLTINWFARLTR